MVTYTTVLLCTYFYIYVCVYDIVHNVHTCNYNIAIHFCCLLYFAATVAVATVVGVEELNHVLTPRTTGFEVRSKVGRYASDHSLV